MNPGARAGGASRRLSRLLAADRRLAEATVATHEVNRLADAIAAIERLDATTVPVAAGGDGTANLVVRALFALSLRRPVGVLPLGTGNAFAHSLGVGTLEGAALALTSGAPEAVDLLCTSHPATPLALVSISVGFESELILRVARRRHLTPLVAALTSLRHAFGRRRGVTLALDGETLLAADGSFYNAGLYAMPCYAFGRRVFPSSSSCDGLAEASLALRSRDYWLGLAHGQGSPRRWRQARLESRLPVQVDGEAVALDGADLWVEPGALEVLVPPSGRPR